MLLRKVLPYVQCTVQVSKSKIFRLNKRIVAFHEWPAYSAGFLFGCLGLLYSLCEGLKTIFVPCCRRGFCRLVCDLL